VLARGVIVIALDERGLGGKEDAEEDGLDDNEEDEEEEDDDDDEEEEEEVSDSSSKLEESILMGLFNDSRIVSDFRTARPGIDIGCNRFRFFLTRDRSFKYYTSYSPPR
jgi:hypothetical protein